MTDLIGSNYNNLYSCLYWQIISLSYSTDYINIVLGLYFISNIFMFIISN
jgi:hypothetical protein